jgi:hypothetical protein
VEETNAAGTVVARYSQTQNIDEPLAMLRSAATSYYHADGLGSVTSPGSFSLTQKGGDDAGIAATVEYGQDNKGFFIRRVRNQKIPNGMKTQWSRSQIGAAVTHLRKGDESTNRFMDFLKNTVSGIRVVGSDEFPDFVQVSERVWMENKSDHEPRRS